MSLDWKWLFIYPEQDVASVNRLVVPAGTPVHFQLTSATVMNSFFVPQLGSQIYTMAGMATQLNLQADKPGTYPGLSAQFSGDGFSDMRFDAAGRAAGRVRQLGYDGARAGGRRWTTAAYAALAQPERTRPGRTPTATSIPACSTRSSRMSRPPPAGPAGRHRTLHVSPRGGN